jgi:biopolymer transport protein TolQ
MIDTSSGQVVADTINIASRDISLWGLFIHADTFVQLIMLLLLAASFWCWTIIFAKYRELNTLNKLADTFEKGFWSGQPLDEVAKGMKPNDPFSRLFLASMHEWNEIPSKSSAAEGIKASLLQRVERIMDASLRQELSNIERHTGFLATVGSSAPFIGLLGTVWGIMHSFQSIAASNNTSLAVVAPGIAEALFATALGLVAAIPAVIAYNKISARITRYSMRLENLAGEISTIMSRKLHGGK